MVELKTERLIIRDFVSEDWKTVHTYGADPEVCRFLPWGPNSEDDTKSFIQIAIDQQAEAPRKSFELAVFTKRNNVHLGGVGIRVKSLSNNDADIGYVMRRNEWGKGYGTEVAKAIIHFGFKELKIKRIEATTLPENTASIEILKKVGMRKEGLLQQHLMVRGKYRDSFLYAILREDGI